MEGKKRYIAIILFLLICLTVFTFATTGDEELENGTGNGNNVQEVTDKGSSDKDDKTESDSKEDNKSDNKDSNSNKTESKDEEDLEGTGNVDNEAWDKALSAVEDLEELLTDEQADIARELVEEIANSDQYKELMDRIEDAEDAIDAAELVEKLEQMVEEAAKKADLDDASDFRDEEVVEAIEEIDGEKLAEVKADLEKRVEELSKILDDDTAPSIEGIEDGKHTKENVGLTITDENEVTTKVTKDGNEIDFAETFTEEGTYEVTVVDAAFNETKVTFIIDKTFKGIQSVNMYTDGNQYGDVYYATNGNTITAYVRVKEQLKEVPTITIEINGKKYLATNVKEAFHNASDKAAGIYRYQATFKVDEFDAKTLGEAKLTISDIYDKAGNTTSDIVKVTNNNVTIVDTVAAIRKSGNYYINGLTLIPEIIDGEEYQVYYTKGDKQLNVNAAFDEELKEMPVFTFYNNGKAYSVTANRTSFTNNKYYYYATFTVPAEMKDGEITYVVSNIIDKAGNKTNDVTGPTNRVRVFLDKTAATRKSTDFYVHGLTQVGKIFYTQKGKKITVNITTNEILGKNPTFTLQNNGKDYNINKVVYRGLNDKGYYLYQADFDLTEEIDMTDGEITFTISNIVDRAGNVTEDITSATNGRRIILDTTAPIATPSYTEKTVEADKTATFTDFPEFTTSEEATVELAEGEVKMGKPGTYVLKYKATDLAGNSEIIEIKITVKDTKKPTATADWWEKTVEADKTATFTEFPVITPKDNAEGELKVTLKSGEVNMAKPGTYKLTYNITDESGNKATYCAKVHVVDTTPATIVLPGVIGRETYEYRVESGTKVTLEDILGTVTDNVDADVKIAPYKADLLIGKASENTYNYDLSKGIDTNYVGRYNIYYTYTDQAGNVSNATLLLFMSDKTAPTLEITEKGNMVYVRGKDVTRLKYTITKDGKTAHTVDSETCGCGNYFSITWLAKTYGDGEYTIDVVDAGGNTATAKALVDTTAPVATPSYTEKTIEVNSVKEFTELPTFEVTDNYSENIKQELVSGKVDTTKVGTYKLVYRFTDEKSNYSEATITVNVVDTTAPEVTPSYTEKTVEEDSVEEFTDFPTFEITDNSNATVKTELIKNTVNVHKVGTYKLVYRFTDESGNYTEKTITVKVVDTTAPTITGIEDGAYYNTKDTHAIPVASDKNGVKLYVKTTIGDTELVSPWINEKEIIQVGTYKVYAEDKYGNKSEEITVHIDPYNPKVLVLDRFENVSGAYLPIKPVILEHNLDKVIVELDGKEIDYTYGDQLTKDGQYKMTVTDKAGNTTTVEFTMDSVAPTMLINPLTLGVVGELDLNDVSSLENILSGIYTSEEVDFQLMKATKNINVLDYNIPIYEYVKLPEDGIVSEEGEYILIAYDKAYNLTAAKFVVDRTAPVINAEDGKFYPSLTLDVKDANLSTITVKKEGSLIGLPVENGYVIDEDGTYEITAKDIVGSNILDDNYKDHITTITIHIDTKTPTTNIVEGGVYTTATPVVEDSNLDENTITINGTKYDGKEITEEGNYTLKAKDLAGNELVVNFEIDKTPIIISGAENNRLYNADVELEVTARDEEAVIKLDGSTIGSKYTITADGKYKVLVTDKWGNEASVEFTIDKREPTIINPFVELNNEIGAKKDSVQSVIANVTDNLDANKTIKPTVTHSVKGNMGELSEIPVTKDYIGTYTLTYTTTDTAGNIADTLVVTVKVIVNDYVLSFVDVDNNNFTYTYGEKINTKVELYSSVLESTVDFAEEDVTIVVEEGTMKNVGTYTVTATIDTTKYPNAKVEPQVFTIVKKDVEVTFDKNYENLSSIDEYEFNGKTDPFKITGIDGVIEGEEVVATITYGDCDFGVGHCVAKVTLDNKNYNVTNPTHEFKITQAIATVKLPELKADGEVDVTNSEGFDINEFVKVNRTEGTSTGEVIAKATIPSYLSWLLGESYSINKKYEVYYTVVDVVAKNTKYVAVTKESIDLVGLGDVTDTINSINALFPDGIKKYVSIDETVTDNLEQEVSKVGTAGTSKIYVTDVKEVK